MTKRINRNDPEVQLRKCLGTDCGKAFLSRWKGNRICAVCKVRITSLENAGMLIDYTVNILEKDDK
jgi:hypothetical protein